MSTALNIVLITSHDLGRHLGCYGVQGTFSPCLNKLAEEGILFEQAFCAQSQCSPSRAAIYTGRHPHSNGVMGLTHRAFGWDLHDDEQHLAGILQEAGYQTALAGLQHETGRPQDMGFDQIRFVHGGNERAAETAKTANALLAEFAEAPGKPFYLQVGFFEPHRAPGHPNHEWGPTPADDLEDLCVPAFLEDNPGTREEIAQMQGAIRAMDAAVGDILGQVERLGLSDQTIVVFTADHGIPFPRAKTSLYDPGLEIALILRGPWADAPKRVQYLISNVDILPSLLDCIGQPIPVRVQGRSFAPLLRGECYGPRKQVFGEMTYHNYCDPMRCVRTKTHKLIVNFMPCASFYNSTQQWRPVSAPSVPGDPKGGQHPLMELYDLENDPLEHANLADSADHVAVRQDLLGRLSRWMQETEDPLLDGVPLPPRFGEAQDLVKNI